MSIEQAILDRLEKRNAQIEMLQQTIQAMSRAADTEREHARQQLGSLVAENKSLNDEITKRDHELRAHEKELAEQREEIRKLRAEVPLESTREGLKNAVAKLQEVNAQLDSAKGEAEEWLKQCHAARRQRDEVREEARKETQRLSDLCAELQSKYESLLAKTTDLGSYAMTIGRKEGEPLEMFMERQALRLAALESQAGPTIETLSAELSVRYAEIAELHKWALVLIENPSFAKNAPEHTRNYRDIVERINSRPQLDLTATLPTIDWQGVASNMQREIARLNAKLGPLQKLFAQLNHHCRENAVSEHVGDIYCQVAEAKTELDRLTA